MRKSTIFLLVTALLLSLAGCSKETAKPTEPALTMKPSESPTVPPTAPLFKTVYYWVMKKDCAATYTRSYDSSGRMLTDAYISSDGSEGYTITYTYDENGKILTIKDEHINMETVFHTFTYDENGNMLTEAVESPSANYTTCYYYDENGYQEKTIVTHRSGSQDITYYTYDPYGQVIEERNQVHLDGMVIDFAHTLYEYDSMGNQISLVQYLDNSMRKKQEWTYDESGRLTGEFIHHNGSPSYSGTVYEYNEQGRLIREFEATFVDGIAQYIPSVQRYIYNDAGQCIERYTEYNGEKGARTVYVYDEHGNLSKELHYESGSDTVSHQTEYTYIAIEVPNN